MATLAGKTVLVIGGSSGIGYGVAKASLLSRAAKVIIGSSSLAKIESALGRIKNDIAVSGQTVEGILSGEVVDAKDSKNVKALFERVGEVDHLVWTSGDSLRLGFPNMDLDANKGKLLNIFHRPVCCNRCVLLRRLRCALLGCLHRRSDRKDSSRRLNNTHSWFGRR